VSGECLGPVLNRAGRVTLLALVVLASAACGSSGASPETNPAVTTATTSSPAAATEQADSAAPTRAPKTAKVEVPRGVGLDYQSAQDLWRAAGLHVAPAKDATGADRIPVIDSNWVVVSQSPEAGSVVDQGSFITATVKKETDD